MAGWSERGWKTSWQKRVEGKGIQQRRMEVMPENGKELSQSAHANGINEWMKFRITKNATANWLWVSHFEFLGKIPNLHAISTSVNIRQQEISTKENLLLTHENEIFTGVKIHVGKFRVMTPSSLIQGIQ